MHTVVIGGTGLIGKQLVARLAAAGHSVRAAAPSTGVDTLSGAGLALALQGADLVYDVSNAPSFEDQAVLHFFQTSTRRLLAASAAAGVRHIVALSVVGADRVPDSGYLRAKLAQEALIRQGPLPYSILRATQFFEFLDSIAQAATSGHTLRLPSALIQPVASADVAAALADLAGAAPLMGIAEIAGPQAWPMDALLRQRLQAQQDPRQVLTDDTAGYFGARLQPQSLTGGALARLGGTTLAQWQAQQPAQAAAVPAA